MVLRVGAAFQRATEYHRHAPILISGGLGEPA
jgi:hypothetical protein